MTYQAYPGLGQGGCLPCSSNAHPPNGSRGYGIGARGRPPIRPMACPVAGESGPGFATEGLQQKSHHGLIPGASEGVQADVHQQLSLTGLGLITMKKTIP